MVQSIRVLPDHVINKIAAGEVVERPASVVKELIENSIDAGATGIFIDIEQAGRRLIRIADNGFGMGKEDARTAFERHATSKIASDSDLEAVQTMGFRGEALSSIASVSHVRLITAERGASSGVVIEIEGGLVKTISDTAASQGATFEISHLFFNTPARLKFLKSPATEFSHILSVVSRQAMASPAIHFRLTHNKKLVFDLPASPDERERLLQLYGRELADNLIAFSQERDGIHLHGHIGRPAYTRADRTYQDFYVNRRAIKNPSLNHALYSAYDQMLMRDRHPVGFIFIEINPALVDVNVHPAKAEVRFRNQAQIHDLLRDVIRERLRAHEMTSSEVFSTTAAFEDRVKESCAEYLKNPAYSCTTGHGQKEPISLDQRRDEKNICSDDRESGLSEEETGILRSSAQTPSFFGQGMHPLAQIHDSYIVAQYQDGMAIVDQHAAHERVLFEKLQDLFSRGAIPVQNLLIPAQVELGPAQGHLLAEFLPELNKFGFLIEEFGNNTFVIKAVPSFAAGSDYAQMLLDILDELNVHDKNARLDRLYDEVLSVMACHPAIKVHRRLERQEMETLLNDLQQCRMPHTCPHGRPTIVRFTMESIKKMFKRL